MSRDFSTKFRPGPVARAELRHLLDGSAVWHVGRCPFCRREHAYAAGRADGDPRRYLGARLSMCSSRARWFELRERP